MNEGDLHSRALRLERLIRQFQISVGGGGGILGGFGRLRSPSLDIHERISNIERSVGKFELEGQGGLTAVGAFNEGYIIKGRRGDDVAGVPIGFGACCIGGICSGVISSEACAAASGIFYPGLDCDPNPCVCDDAGVGITLACDQILAGRLKCGHAEFGTPSEPPRFYLTGVWTWTDNQDTDAGCFMNNSITTTINYDPDDDCATPESICSGGWSSSISPFSATWESAGTGNVPGSISSAGYQSGDCGYSVAGLVACNVTFPCVPSGGTTTTTSRSHSCSATSGTAHDSGSFNFQLSVEYTTDMLIDNAVNALPDYSGAFDCDAEFEEGQSCDCFSFRYLSDDDPLFFGTPEYDIARFKPKFTFTAQAFDFQIHYVEHTEFDAGGEEDIGRILTVTAGLTEIEGPEVMEPDENGFTEIETDSIQSCLIP